MSSFVYSFDLGFVSKYIKYYRAIHYSNLDTRIKEDKILKLTKLKNIARSYATKLLVNNDSRNLTKDEFKIVHEAHKKYNFF